MHDTRTKLARAAVFAAALGLAGPALAEDALNLLIDAPAVKVEQVAKPVDAKAVDAKAADKPLTSLIPFEEGTDRFELAGERDTVVLTLSVSAADVERGGKLVLAYKNAVSVMPDSARMSVELNGADLGELPIASPFDSDPRHIVIPPGLLKIGRNDVRIRAMQHHRVDCSMDATYELWTRIDPARSGLDTGSPLHFSSVEDLVRVGRMDGGQTEIRLVLPAAASADNVNEALPLIQALSLYLNRQDIVVSIAQEPGTGPGIDLFAGTDDPSDQTEAGVRILAEAPYGLSVTDAGEGRARVTLKGSGHQEMTASLLAALRGPMAEGLASGVKAPRFGELVVEADQTYTLRQAGYRSTSFSGRLMRQRFTLVLPADFYPADYATLDLSLNAATAAGLLPAAQLLVRVNDRVVNSFPFRNTDGETFADKKIELPLRAFRPGVNQVELLAELPITADEACLPNGRKDDVPRFILLDTTEIRVPPLARMSRLPDLSAFAGKGWPYASGQPFSVYVADPDSQSVSAALTLITRMAMSAKSPLKAKIGFGGVPETGAEPSILLTTRSIGEEGAKPDKVAALFPVDREAMLPGSLDNLATAGILSVPASPVDSEGDADKLLESFQQNTLAGPEPTGFSARMRSFMSAAGSRFSNWLSYQSGETALHMDEAKSLVSLRQTEKPIGEGFITVISADDTRTLNIGMGRLVSPAIWTRLDGGSAMIGRSDLALVTWPAPERTMSSVTDWSPGNLRRIVAAWSSDNFNIYVLALIGLAVLFAAWLSRIVPKLGVRTEP